MAKSVIISGLTHESCICTLSRAWAACACARPDYIYIEFVSLDQLILNAVIWNAVAPFTKTRWEIKLKLKLVSLSASPVFQVGTGLGTRLHCLHKGNLYCLLVPPPRLIMYLHAWSIPKLDCDPNGVYTACYTTGQLINWIIVLNTAPCYNGSRSRSAAPAVPAARGTPVARLNVHACNRWKN